LYSYPDMVTQTISIFDCEPLEFYFDVTAAANSRWRDWQARRLIEGMNASNAANNQFKWLGALAKITRGQLPGLINGASECVNGWRGLTPLVHNPQFNHDINNFAPAIGQAVHWSHWEDLQRFYGESHNGYANSTWDNVGVQYGLRALTERQITVEEFLHLNANIGGWKPAQQMQAERYWLLMGEVFPLQLSIWSDHNLYQRARGHAAARRTQGSREAMVGAYRSGHVFLGYADLPIIDLRHYLDPVLDMHHATASFAARQRLLNGQGYADNQVIWMSDQNFNPTAQAFAVIDQWMQNIRDNPLRSVGENKPTAAQDKCFNANGEVIAVGDTVWDGDWNQRRQGACAVQFPRFKTSREVAGDSVAGDVFKCHLQSVDSAVANGVYGELDMHDYLSDLRAIFPDGVCDYSRGDAARPTDLLE